MRIATRSRTILAVAVSAAIALSLPAGAATAASGIDEDTIEHEVQQIHEQRGMDTSLESLETTVVTPADADGNFEVSITRAGATGFSVTCAGTTSTNAVRDPHYSAGAGGAIFKTEIWCSGTGNAPATVDIKHAGSLYFAPSNSANNTSNLSFSSRASSSLTQNVVVNGTGKTFYTPKQGENVGRGTGFWRATATWYFEVGGQLSTVGSQTKTVWKTI